MNLVLAEDLREKSQEKLKQENLAHSKYVGSTINNNSGRNLKRAYEDDVQDY